MERGIVGIKIANPEGARWFLAEDIWKADNPEWSSDRAELGVGWVTDEEDVSLFLLFIWVHQKMQLFKMREDWQERMPETLCPRGSSQSGAVCSIQRCRSLHIGQVWSLGWPCGHGWVGGNQCALASRETLCQWDVAPARDWLVALQHGNGDQNEVILGRSRSVGEEATNGSDVLFWQC